MTTCFVFVASSTALAAARTVAVTAAQPWTDTGVDVIGPMTMQASGIINVGGPEANLAPAGSVTGCVAGPSSFGGRWVADGFPCWSLIGRIGNGQPFRVGNGGSFSVPVGRLYLGVDDEVDFFGDNSGSWTVQMTFAVPPNCANTGGAYHCYVTARQAFSQPTANGIAAQLSEPASLPGVGADGYSIGQLALISSGPILQKAIEFGWMVNPSKWGDSRPHLFIALRFAPGAGTCFVGIPNLVGDERSCPANTYVQLSSTLRPGSAVGSSAAPQMYHMGYFGNNKAWWIQYGNQWLGYVNESYWGTLGFAKGNELQWYGEVVFSNNPCIPMGNSKAGSDPSATSIAGMFYEVPTGVVSSQAALSQSDSRFWTAGNTSTSGTGVNGFRYGGRGSCR